MSEDNRQESLTQLNIFLENNSSLACRFGQDCSRAATHGNGGKHILPVEHIYEAIDQALPLGLRTVRISGGEPFLYPRLDALLDRLERLELGVTIETGGSGLTHSRAARLAHLPQVRVLIGIDEVGPLTHDAIHDQPGDFEVGMHATRRLSAAGLSPQIHFSVTRKNYAQLSTIIRLVELLGGDSIHFASANPQIPAQPGKNGSLVPAPAGAGATAEASAGASTLTTEEWIALGRKVERELSKTTRLRLSLDLPPVFRGLHPQARVEGQGRCQVLNSLALLSSGEYALCGGAAAIPDLVFGSAGDISLDQIWTDHPTLASLREALPGRLEGICGRCIMKTACLGFCAAENYLYNGSFEGANAFCESAEHIGLFPAGRLIENLLW